MSEANCPGCGKAVKTYHSNIQLRSGHQLRSGWAVECGNATGCEVSRKGIVGRSEKRSDAVKDFISKVTDKNSK